LIKPVNSQFLISLNRANPIAFIRVIIGIVLFSIILPSLKIQLTYQLIAGYILLLLFGLLIMYSSWFIVATLLIWFDRLSNLISLMYNITSMANRPTEMYLKISSYLIYILPIILISAVPSRFLLHKTTSYELIIFGILTASILGISIIFWRYALRSYTSVSS
jgi:ABC-2 type transport system permease protein